jgi:hypothetical protein
VIQSLIISRRKWPRQKHACTRYELKLQYRGKT